MKKEFNEIAKKVTDFMAGAANKAVRYVDEKCAEADIIADVKEKEKELEELYTLYGKTIYAIGKVQHDHEKETICFKSGEQIVRELYKQIEEKTEQLELAQAILENFRKETGKLAVKCTNCDAEFKKGEQYCSNCGTKLE